MVREVLEQIGQWEGDEESEEKMIGRVNKK